MLDNWIIMFILAIFFASMTAVFARTALFGLSGPQTLLTASASVLVLSFTTLSFSGFFKSAKAFGKGSIEDILIEGALLAAGFVCLLIALGMAETISTACFYLLVPVAVFAVNIFLSRKIPQPAAIVINVMTLTGVLAMGFSIKHKKGLWWLPAFLSVAFLTAERIYAKANPIGRLERVAAYFVIALIALVLSFVVRHKDLKKITAYHVLFAIFTGIAFYYGPICLHRALAISSFDLWLSLIYNLWLVFTVAFSRLFLREKGSAGTYAGLGLIAGAEVISFVLQNFI